jgi:hypothetical protein
MKARWKKRIRMERTKDAKKRRNIRRRRRIWGIAHWKKVQEIEK